MSPAWPNGLRLLALGESAWTLEFDSSATPEAHHRVMALAGLLQVQLEALQQRYAVQDIVISFRSLTVHFDPLHRSDDDLGQRLLTMAQHQEPSVHSGRCWRLPLCCDLSVAPDLADLAAATGLSVETVISQFSQAPLRVAMIGFMPGFPYMTGLPATLALPRRATPRKAVPARSVAVAGEMACIYPWQSPGGWHLLGRCPLPMFELAHPQQAAWLQAGDEVHWQLISLDALTALEQRVQRGEWLREDFLIPSVEPVAS